ncbi:SMI1/KNR4 family protein [Pseudomonas sp. D2-30]|uniref:SMI1/KNR4 family protein n=1 Tax=unclassified Pseudomonas TaxID=196821 RepID=UPI003DA91CC5
MRLTLEESEHALSVQELNEFQEKFNVELPTAFRQFYLKHNGGDLAESNSENDFLLGGFTPIKYGQAPIETVYRDLTDDVPSLKQMIPFAYDHGGNSFLLSVKEADFGNIYLYLMDEEDLAFVCESFEEFLAELTGQ